MNWENVYLICFLVGFLLSLVSLFGQLVHFDGGNHGGHMPHLHVGGDHVAHAAGAHGAHAGGADVESAHPAGTPAVSRFNFMTFSAFLAWFGGTGYLLTRYSSIWIWFGFAIANFTGLIGSAIVFVVLKNLLAREHNMDPADYDMVGVLGSVASSVRENGTGEMTFTQNGVHRAVPIRSDTGRPIDKGTEVVVTRYEKGIAYVRRWEELAGESAATVK